VLTTDDAQGIVTHRRARRSCPFGAIAAQATDFHRVPSLHIVERDAIATPITC